MGSFFKGTNMHRVLWNSKGHKGCFTYSLKYKGVGTYPIKTTISDGGQVNDYYNDINPNDTYTYTYASSRISSVYGGNINYLSTKLHCYY